MKKVFGLYIYIYIYIYTHTHTHTYIYTHGSVHRESNLIIVQQDATYSIYCISVGSSTCFGCWHPSWGAGTAVITASGIGQPGLLPSALVVEFSVALLMPVNRNRPGTLERLWHMTVRGQMFSCLHWFGWRKLAAFVVKCEFDKQ